MKCGEDESTKRNQCTVHERENKCQYQCGKMKDARKRRTEAPGLDEFWEYSAGPGYGKRIKQHYNVEQRVTLGKMSVRSLDAKSVGGCREKCE